MGPEKNQKFFEEKEHQLFSLISLFSSQDAFVRQGFIHLAVIVIQLLQFAFFTVNADLGSFCRDNAPFLHDFLGYSAVHDVWSPQTTAYLSIAWIFTLYLILSMNVWSFKRSRGEVFGVLLKPLLGVTMVSNTVLVIPISLAFFHHWNGEGESNAWESTHLLFSLIGMIFFALFVAFGLVSSAIVFPHKGDTLVGRVHGRLHVVELLLKILMAFVYVFIDNSIVSLATLCGVAVTMLYGSVKLVPFLQRKMNTLYAISWAIALWTVVCAAVAELDTDGSCDNSANLLLYTSLPVVVLFAWLLVKMRYADVGKMPFSEVQDPYLLEFKAREMLKESSNSDATVQEVFDAFKRAASLFPSALLHYFFAKFFAKVKKNHHMAANQLAKSKALSPAFDIRFLLTLMQKDSHGVSFVVDSESRVEFEELLSESQLDGISALRSQLNFWNACLTEYPDLEQLYKHAKRVHECSQNAERKYRRLFEINPHSTAALRKYSGFLSDVANDEMRGHEMMVTADRIVERMSTESDNCDMLTVFENIPIAGGLSLMDDRNAVVTVSTAPKDFGNIIQVNPCVSRLFGFQQAWLVGNKISLIIPHPLDHQILTLLETFVSTGESSVIDSTRTLLVQHRSGHLFPVLVTFHPLTASNAMVLVFRSLEKSQDFLMISQSGRVLGGSEGSLEKLNVTSDSLKSSETPLGNWVESVSNLLKVGWKQLPSTLLMEDLQHLDGLIATKQTDAKTIKFRPKKRRRSKLGKRAEDEKPVTMHAVINTCFFESDPESGVYILRWNLGSGDNETDMLSMFSPTPETFSRRLALPKEEDDDKEEEEEAKASDDDEEEEEEGEQDEGNRRVRFLMDDNIEGFTPLVETRILSEPPHESTEDEVRDPSLEVADTSSVEEKDVVVHISDHLPAVMKEQPEERKAVRRGSVDNADRVSVARSGTSSRNSSINSIRNVLISEEHGRDSTVRRLHLVVVITCLIATLLGVFLVVNTISTLDTFAVNVNTIQEAGHRVYHIECIMERARHLDQVNTGQDHADDYDIASEQMLAAIVDVEEEQDILFSRRDADLHPPELIAMDEAPKYEVVEFTGRGTRVKIMANLNEAVRMYASRARVFHALEPALQNANHSTFKFIFANAAMLRAAGVRATDLYESVADGLSSDISTTIQYSYFGVSACLLLLLICVLTPILWRTEKAKDHILSSFLTLSLTDLEVLAESTEEKIRAKVSDEDQDDEAFLGEGASKKHKRHKERATTGHYRKSYARFFLNIGRFAVPILLLLGFFTFVFFSVQNFKSKLETFTAEINVAALRLTDLSRSVIYTREMLINTPPECYKRFNQTETTLDDMMEIHHDLLYGNDERGLPGALGRLPERDHLLMASTCHYVAPWHGEPCETFLNGISDHGFSAALSHFYQMVKTMMDERFTLRTANDTVNPMTYPLLQQMMSLYKWFLSFAALEASELYMEEVAALKDDNGNVLTAVTVAMCVLVLLLYIVLLRRVMDSIDQDIKLSRWMLLMVPYSVLQGNERLVEQVRALKRKKE